MSDYSAVAPPPQQNFNQSSAFAAALQRAKQIAAKINPASTGETRPKRSLEDSSEPDAKKGPGANTSPAHSNSVGRPPIQNMGPPGLGPPGIDDMKPDKIGGLRMNNVGMGPGGPGGRNSIEIMIPGPKVGLIIGKGGETIKQLQEKSGAKMVVIQEGPNQEHEKPLVISGDPQKVEYAKQLVYDLIAEKEMKNFNRAGGRGRNQGSNDGYSDFGGGGGDQMEVLVPRPAVGVVIGKGGDMIKKIQAETGAKVQFQQARDEGPGDRRCFLSGNPKQVEMARQRIDELIDSVLQRDGGGGDNGMGGPMGGMRGGRGGGRGRGGHFGGRGGAGGGGFDRGDRNGGGGGDFGANQWDDRRSGGAGGHQGGPGGSGGGQEVVSFTVPANKCGVIIGRGGETIKQINQQSGAYCELDRRSQNSNANEKIFLIKGDPESIETAKRIIQDKVQMPLNFVSQNGPAAMSTNMPTAYPGMAPQGYNPQNNWGMQAGNYQQQQQWGGQPQGAESQQAPPNSVQMNPSTGQPDYSMQWAEYYRSLGMHREAEIIEQQAKAKVASGAAAPGMPQSAPVAGAASAAVASAAGQGQADYSAQWAEYYRSIGKVKEAEVIEAQMKNKGSTSAPPGATTAPGAQSGAYQTPQGQAYAGYQPQAAAAGYYGGQPQATAVPGGVPQGNYGFPSYNYGNQPGSAPTPQDN
ncbi:unnamed protein product [Phyllotreta striolata]|uniref:K Homology domain-containing protein n=1 Tax=Phyllotreta striolata TaxID=444603 RepID=A0A9N9XIG3_PHYSR|nr:unnamed protein product [Phyllotreta striolata]